MPTITIEISDGAKQRLDLVVADYNATNGTSLTFDDWLGLHLREMAIQREFAAKIEQLKRQTEDDLAAAVNAEKERLLAAVDGGDA
jgi:hypothetical protein